MPASHMTLLFIHTVTIMQITTYK